MRSPVLAAALLGLLPLTLAAQHSGSSAEPQWAVAPALFPPGARMALVSGNPFEPGPLTALLRMPDGHRIPPHVHEADTYRWTSERTDSSAGVERGPVRYPEYHPRDSIDLVLAPAR